MTSWQKNGGIITVSTDFKKIQSECIYLGLMAYQAVSSSDMMFQVSAKLKLENQ
jgi:hypothetical protein